MAVEKEPRDHSEAPERETFGDKVEAAMLRLNEAIDHAEDKPFNRLEQSFTTGTVSKIADKVNAAEDKAFERLGNSRVARGVIKASESVDKFEDRIFGIDNDPNKDSK